MSGILNSKERILDVLMTNFGLEKLVIGGSRIKYFSFSDSEVSYSDIEMTSSKIPEYKIITEANNSNLDSLLVQMFKEKELSAGDIVQKTDAIDDIVKDIVIKNGTFFSSSINLNNSLIDKLDLVSEQFLNSIHTEFKEAKPLYTLNNLFEDDEFQISSNEISFNIAQLSNQVINNNISFNSMSPIFLDERVTNVYNKYKYLPAVFYDESGNKKNLSTNIAATSVFNNNIQQEKIIKSEQNNLFFDLNFDLTSLRNTNILQCFTINSKENLNFSTKKQFNNLFIFDHGIKNLKISNQLENCRLLLVGTVLYNNSIPYYFNLFDIIFRR